MGAEVPSRIENTASRPAAADPTQLPFEEVRATMKTSAAGNAAQQSPPPVLPARAEAARRDLSGPERLHLERMLRRERSFSIFMFANLAVAAALSAYYTGSGSWSVIRTVLVALILLSARAHLRQLRSARLLRKLSGPGTTSC